MNAVQELLKTEIRLPSPPAIALRILEAVRKKNSSFGELAEIISADPVLTAKVLKVANSAFYALPYKVDNVHKALSILGVNALKNIALSFVIMNGLPGDSTENFNLDFFWRRAITTAVGSDLLAPLIGSKVEDIFVTSLLQDVGVIVLNCCRPDEYAKVLEDRKISQRPIEQIEKDVLGYDHQEVGSEVLKQWGLPATIYEPIRYHHSPADAPSEYKTQTDVLYISDKIAAGYYGQQGGETLGVAKKILKSKFDLDHGSIEKYIDSVAGKSIEILSSFEIDPGELKPYSQILQEANEELNKLNISYEQLLIEFKQAKERAENLAEGLMDANSRLKELVSRDGLTDLFNHRHFQEVMNRELSEAKRYDRTFSLVMFDIDHFKKINDSHGHQGGDIILKGIGTTVKSLIRDCDTAARYGGEEFCLILPETDARGAVIVAERLRRAIEDLETVINGHKAKVTVSLGVATHDPDGGLNDKAVIIAAADKALFKSKMSGRNRVSFMENQTLA